MVERYTFDMTVLIVDHTALAKIVLGDRIFLNTGGAERRTDAEFFRTFSAIEVCLQGAE